MGSKGKYYHYWDSCVFLAFVNEEPGRVEVIERLWREITEEKDGKIVTSALSIAEVAYGVIERQKRQLDPNIEAKIDAMWHDPSLLIVEAPMKVMYDARQLMRDALQNHWSLKSYDAVHLATAVFADNSGRLISEFNTYDDKLEKFGPMTGLMIREPYCDPKAQQLDLI